MCLSILNGANLCYFQSQPCPTRRNTRRRRRSRRAKPPKPRPLLPNPKHQPKKSMRVIAFVCLFIFEPRMTMKLQGSCWGWRGRTSSSRGRETQGPSSATSRRETTCRADWGRTGMTILSNFEMKWNDEAKPLKYGKGGILWETTIDLSIFSVVPLLPNKR